MIKVTRLSKHLTLAAILAVGACNATDSLTGKKDSEELSAENLTTLAVGALALQTARAGSTTSAASAVCGNQVLESGEACEDSDTTSGDGCSSTCQYDNGFTNQCGNGILGSGEECDDNDTLGGNGCSAVCLMESSYACTGFPSTCSTGCGNGALNTGAGEQCDDGNLINGDGCTDNCRNG